MSLWIKIILSLLLIPTTFVVYLFWQIRSITVETLSDELSVIRGMGGNSTVLKTDVGTVVIDSMAFPMQGSLIRKKAQQLTGDNVVLLINTHYHQDHTHGNPAFDTGIRVIATEQTRSHLKTLDARFWQGDAAAFIPNETFHDRMELQLGDKTLQLIHPGNGHTNGDLVVLIEQTQTGTENTRTEKTLVMGDLLFHKHYPNIDLEAGGSVQDWPATLDQVLQLTFDSVVPGHGATTDRSGIEDFQRFISQLANIGLQAKVNNTSLEDMLKSDQLTADNDYTPIKFAGISIGLTRKFVLRRAWEEATGNIERIN